jgi:hypothetical protein
MSKFITQTVEDKPQVLLVAFESWLSRELKRFIESQDLAVVQLAPDELSADSFQENLFYKTIFLGGWSEQFANLRNITLSKIYDLLKNQPEVVAVLAESTLETQVDNSLFWKLDKVILGLDVVAPQNNNWPLFQFITRDIELGILVDPQLDVFLQSGQAFVTQLKTQLLSPVLGKMIIGGSKKNTGQIIKEIKRQYGVIFNKDLIIKQLPKKSTSLPTEFITQDSNLEDIPSLISDSIRLPIKKSPPIIKTPEPALQQTSKIEVKPVVEEQVEEKVEPVVKQVKPQLKVQSKVQPKQPDPETEIDEQLKEIFKVKRVKNKVERVKENTKKTHQTLSKNKHRKKSFWVGLGVTGLAMVFVILFGFFKYSEYSLLQAVSAQNTEVVRNKANSFNAQLSIYSKILPAEFLSKSYLVAEVGLDLPQVEDGLKQLEEYTTNTIRYFWGDLTAADPTSNPKSDQLLKDTYSDISQAYSRLEDIRVTLKDSSKQERLKEITSQLDETRQKLIVAQQIQPILDYVLGLDQKRRIALVLQNNHELRPTGGFIQAVAILTVDRGMVIDVDIHSSYELDEMLAGDVKPPDEVIDLLGENKWYLRDSNWDPDFSQSGKQIAWFIEQQTNQKIDMVVATNLLGLQDYIKALGPLDLPEFNEVLTEKNLLERAEYHSEIKLVDDDEQVDYLSLVLTKFILKLRAVDEQTALAFGTQFYQTLENKQTLLYSSDSGVEDTFAALNWSGNLIQPNCPSQLATSDCQVDSLAVIDANIGVNKANYHTDRTEEHRVEIQSDQVVHTRMVTLNNKAQVNAWPKGEYRSYLRFYLPKNAQEMSLLVNGKNAEAGTYKISKGSKFTVVGVITKTPIKKQTQIEISYTLPLEVESDQDFSYVFFNQIQAGIENSLKEVVIKYDPALSPTLIAPQAEVGSDKVIFEPQDEDHFFGGVTLASDV